MVEHINENHFNVDMKNIRHIYIHNKYTYIPCYHYLCGNRKDICNNTLNAIGNPIGDFIGNPIGQMKGDIK